MKTKTGKIVTKKQHAAGKKAYANIKGWTLKNGNKGVEHVCLDYFGEEFATCYTLVADAEGINQEEVAWEFSVKAKSTAGVSEAITEGGSPDEAHLMCGRRYKKMGKYAIRQIEKFAVDKLSSTAAKIKKSKKAMNKIEARAQKLKLFVKENDPLNMNNEW